MFGKKKEEQQKLPFDISKFNTSEQDEIERIKAFLEPSEIIKVVARQSKIMPGGKLITPNTIFATDKRILIRDPNALGLRADIDSIPYSQINNIKLIKGIFTSEIIIESGQFEDDTRGYIHAIPKKKAAKILGVINEHIRVSQQYHVVSPDNENKDDDDPLIILKRRLAKGEITKEEFDKLKMEFE
jgi:hypothetical protein